MTNLDELKRYADWFRAIGRSNDGNIIDDALAELASLRAAQVKAVKEASKE